MNAFLEQPKGWLSGFVEPKSKPKREYQQGTDCVVFVPVKCPYCQSVHVWIYGRDGKIRYHFCKDCKKKFKSIEQE